MTTERSIGVFGATLVGIGGILGGGLMVLLGTAFEMAGPAAILALRSCADDAVGAILHAAARADLVIVGLGQARGRRMLGEVNKRVAFESPGAVMLLARRPTTIVGA